MKRLTAKDVARIATLIQNKTETFDAWVRFGGSLTKDAYFEAKDKLAETRTEYHLNGYDL
jgi:hypothetical protein